MFKQGGTPLGVAVRNWPTPTDDDANNATRDSGQYQSLTREVQKWATPCHGDSRGAGPNQHTHTLGRDVKKSDGGQLNPDWVEWLMGWPIGWTSMESQVLSWWGWEVDPAESEGLKVPRVGSKIPNRVNRLKAIGNGQVSECARQAFLILVGGCDT